MRFSYWMMDRRTTIFGFMNGATGAGFAAAGWQTLEVAFVREARDRLLFRLLPIVSVVVRTWTGPRWPQ